MSEKTQKNRLKIGWQIKNRRIELGLTQAILGEMLCIQKATISSIENGKWSVSIDKLHDICEVLELEIILKAKQNASNT